MYKAKYHRDLGKVFGFPDCCITAFVDRHKRGIMPGRGGPFRGTGFVPCSVCKGVIAKIGAARFVKERIEPARQVSTQFPEHSRSEALQLMKARS